MKRAVAFVAAIFAGVALLASPAFAHASIETTDPAANATLPAGRPPAAITLTFSEGVQVPDDAVELLDSEGAAVEGVSKATHGDSSAIVVAPLPALDDGTYVVNWHVVSTDAHPINGAFVFSVGESTADPDTVAGLLDDETGRGVGISFALTRALAFGAVLVLIGALVFVRVGWPVAAADRGVRSVLWLSWGVALVTAPVGIALQAAYTNRSELSAAWDLDVLADVVDTRFGQGWIARIGLLLLAIPFVRRAERRRAPIVTAAQVALAAGLVGSISVAGHARTGRVPTLATVVDVAHLGGAAVWLGGVTVLAVALCRSARSRGSVEAAHRFSDLAAPAMAVVVVTGTVQSWRQVDGIESIVDTTYGRLLLAKLGLVILVLAAASASRAIVRNRMAIPLAPAGPGAARLETDPDDFREFRNSVVVEVAFAALILVVTAVLVNTEPARGEVADEQREAASVAPAAGYDQVLRGEELEFVVTVAPALSGTNDLLIAVRTTAGDAFEPIEISATFEESAQGIPPIEVPLEALGAGSYRGTVQFPFAGDWELEIRALRTEIDQEVATDTVPVG